MRAKLEHLSSHSNQSFHCYDLDVPSFDLYWHYHPEYELTLIIAGKGKRLVGNSYETFSSGDFVLLGPNVPHTWISEKKRRQRCRAIVLQFSKKFIEPFLQYRELKEIEKLLVKSDKGIHFVDRRAEVTSLIEEIPTLEESFRLIQLIHILQKLTRIKSVQLNANAFKPMKGNIDQRRINKVFQYVQDHYKQNVSLKKAAAMINLSESAFCKYFKRLCGKTFSDYVNEIRIASACQLLIETEHPISRIASESGFESLTYFNRVFLKKKGIKPKELRKFAVQA
jgi:AraC-like DNA-binding protein